MARKVQVGGRKKDQPSAMQEWFRRGMKRGMFAEADDFRVSSARAARSRRTQEDTLPSGLFTRPTTSPHSQTTTAK